MNRFLLTLFLFITGLSSEGQSIADSISIRLLLEKESATWRAQDSAGHASCWAIQPYSKIWISLKNGSVLDVDPQQMIRLRPSQMGNGGYAVNSNYCFQISGNQAWVSHREISVTTDGSKTNSLELRLLEKLNDEWKLVGQSIHILPD